MKVLIWKEWREQRLFLILAIGIILLTRIFLQIVSLSYDKEVLMLGVRVFWLPLLFTLFLGVLPFTNEFSNKTHPFLLAKPISAAKIFWVKYLFNLFLLLVLILISQLVFCIESLPFTSDFSIDVILLSAPSLFLAYIMIYSAAFLSSLFVNTTLAAVLSTPFVLLLGKLVISPLPAALILLPSSENFPRDLSLYFFLPLIPLFIILGFLTWRQAISRGVNQTRAGVVVLLICLAVFLFFAGGVLAASVRHFFITCIHFLISLFLIFSLLAWRKAVSRGSNPVAIIVLAATVTLVVSLGIYAIFDISASRQLARTIQHAKASGIKLTLEEIFPSPVPDEENAAFVYQEAFILSEQLREKHKDEWEYMPYEGRRNLDELTPEQKKNIARLLLKEADFLKLFDLIEKAVNLPSCRFDLKYEEGPAMPLPHLARMRELARLVAAQTYIFTEEKRHQEALESARVSLRLGDLLNDEPSLTSQLARIAIDDIAMDSLQLLLKTFPEEFAVSDYQKLITIIDAKQGLTKGLEGELVILIIPLFEKILEGELREARFLAYGHRESFTEGFFWRVYFSYLGKPIRKQDYRLLLRYLTTGISLLRLPYYQARDNFSKGEQLSVLFHTRPPKHPMSAMYLPLLGLIPRIQSEYFARLGAFKITLALKIYKAKTGKYPDKMNELTPDIIPELPFDPFTGKNYIYWKEGEGFIVYSVGLNQEDNHGVLTYPRNEEYDDIAWKCGE